MTGDTRDTARRVSPLRREEIAHVEVGHTDVAPTTARAIVAWFLAMLVLLPVVEWAGERARHTSDLAAPGAWSHLAAIPSDVRARLSALSSASAAPTLWERLVAGNRALLAGFGRFEDALEDGSPVGQWLRPPVQAALSGWPGAGNERVYVGREGWLFFRPDVEYVTGPGFLDTTAQRRRVEAAREIDLVPAPDPRPAVLQFARDLAARNITLVVVPTPGKPTIHPERLGGERRSHGVPLQNPSYEAFVADLRRAGVRVFDPAPLLARAAAESGRPQYLATDTHWRPEAMQRVAAALAAFLEREVGLPPAPAPAYRVEPRQARHLGDTLVMLDLPEDRRAARAETVDLAFVLDPDGDPWRASRQADVLLLGDSFTNIYSQATMGWGEASGLAEHLSVALRRRLDRLVQNDEGAHATRAALVREVDPARGATSGDSAGRRDRLAGKRIVVWQFASRELAFGDWRVMPLPATPATDADARLSRRSRGPGAPVPPEPVR